MQHGIVFAMKKMSFNINSKINLMNREIELGCKVFEEEAKKILNRKQKRDIDIYKKFQSSSKNDDDDDDDEEEDEKDEKDEEDEYATKFGKVIREKKFSKYNERVIDILKELHDVLIKPIEEYLPKDRTSNIVIVPHGILTQIPMNALCSEEGKYLIDKYNISISYSLKMIKINKFQIKDSVNYRKKKRCKSLLLVQSGRDLKFTKAEINKLETLFSKKYQLYKKTRKKKLSKFTTYVITCKHVSEKIMESFEEKGNPQIVHFSSHGADQKSDYIKEKSTFGASGYLLLEKDKDDPKSTGVVDAELIENDIDMRGNELTCLATCHGAKGKSNLMTGTRGLVHAFFCANAPSVLANLWKVNDYIASELYPLFYANLLTGHTKASSLRIALDDLKFKLKDLKDSPLLWAPFHLYGHNGPLNYLFDYKLPTTKSEKEIKEYIEKILEEDEEEEGDEDEDNNDENETRNLI